MLDHDRPTVGVAIDADAPVDVVGVAMVEVGEKRGLRARLGLIDPAYLGM
jgi:hypothetical protein